VADKTDIVRGALHAGDLLPLPLFERRRRRLQAEVLSQRKDRAVQVGPSATLNFENETTVRFRVQEILREGAISGDAAVQNEIDIYASLIPDGTNLKAAFRLDFANAVEREVRLAEFAGIESYVWAQVEGLSRVYALADRDVNLESADPNAARHYLRFELGEDGARSLKQGRSLSFGVDHPAYSARALVGENVRRSLLQDLR
jgi:hypothetical protein